MSQKPTIKVRRLRPDTEPLIILCKRPRPPVDDSQPWSTQYLIDELTISLLDTKAVFCMRNTNKKRKTTVMSDPKQLEENDRFNSGTGVLRRLYEEQARYKMYRIPVFRSPPVFVVYLKHLDGRVKQELSNLDSELKDYVMREAIGRIFEQIDRPFFLLSVRPLLQWRLE